MNEAVALQLVIGLFTVGGAWAAMRSQLQRAMKDIEDLRDTTAGKGDVAFLKTEMAALNSLLMKVSLQVAYLNGQLAAKRIVSASIPNALKLP